MRMTDGDWNQDLNSDTKLNDSDASSDYKIQMI
jgi:hypothetical protein